MTDALWMPGIRRGSMSDSEIALAALAAGADCLLAPPDPVGLRRSVEARQDLRPSLEHAFDRSQRLRQGLAEEPDLSGTPPDWDQLAAELNHEIAAGRT